MGNDLKKFSDSDDKLRIRFRNHLKTIDLSLRFKKYIARKFSDPNCEIDRDWSIFLEEAMKLDLLN